MARERIPQHEAKAALAAYMFDHPPLTAEFVNQLATRVAKILDKVTDKVVPWSTVQAMATLRALEADGHVDIEGSRAKPTRATWVGPNPETIDFGSWARPKTADVDPSLAERVAALEAQVARIPELVRQAVDLALEAWTR